MLKQSIKKREEFVRACHSSGYLFAGAGGDRPSLDDDQSRPVEHGRTGLLTAVEPPSGKEPTVRSLNHGLSNPKETKTRLHSRQSSGVFKDSFAKHRSNTNTRPTTANILTSAEGAETSERRPSHCRFVYRASHSRIGSGLVKRRAQGSILLPQSPKKRVVSSDHQSVADLSSQPLALPATQQQQAPPELRIQVNSFKSKDLKLTVPSPSGSPKKSEAANRSSPKLQTRTLPRRLATAVYTGSNPRLKHFGTKPPSPSGKQGLPQTEEGQQDQAILHYIDRQMYTKNRVIKKLNEYLKEQPVISETLVDYKEKLIEFHYQEIKSQLSSKLSQLDFDEVFHRDHHKNLDEKKEMVAAFLLGFSHNTRYKKFCKLFKHYLDKSDVRNSSKVGIVKGLVSVSDFWDENFYREVMRQGDYHTIKTQFRKKFKDAHIL